MPKQDAKRRIRNFDEVALGYTEDQAQREASRCLLCLNPNCSKSCPVGINIPGFIRLIKEKKYEQALKKIKEKSSFPIISCRICPQEEQCQNSCMVAKKGDAVQIGRLERFVADLGKDKQINKCAIRPALSTGKKVAVIGSGPSGLTVASNLAKFGHEVVIFEALPVAGGVLAYGIPEFRLPKCIVKEEIERTRNLGVKIYTNIQVAKISAVDSLIKEGFDAVFIGAGAGIPQSLGIPGESLRGIYPANDFLMYVNFSLFYQCQEFENKISVGKRVAVIGGGNVAIDAARTALRLGAEKATIFYRRSYEEMPARKEEIENAEEEGVEFKFLCLPKRFIGDEEGHVKYVEYVQMKLGEPDTSGRRRPIPITGSERIVEVDFVAIAIGRRANSIVQGFTKGIGVKNEGIIVTEDETTQTSHEGIYAGGDIATGEATVISAMASGRKAARYIDEYLMKACRYPQIVVKN
ncbi:MAG: NADPH-dependent glutamate synthase [Candidatus Bathyarchaeota archaeon]|nr:NADPH-dependent glutamate synthase [Candidatus Bathyarchaeota archaeon]